MRINKVDVAATAKNLRRIASSSNLGDTEQRRLENSNWCCNPKVDVAATAKNLSEGALLVATGNLGSTEQNNMDCVPSISSCCYGNSDTINDELTFQKGPNTTLTDGQSAPGTPDSNVHGATSSQLDRFHISL